MRGDEFWKGLTTLCITFGIGFFASGNIEQEESKKSPKPAKNAVVARRDNSRNCIREYKKFDKYSKDSYPFHKAINELIEIDRWFVENKNASPEEIESYRKKEKAILDKLFPNLYEGKRKFYEDEKVLSQNLIYLEKCYEF